MEKPTKILLQTTIPRIEDDWHIGRFSLLRDFLAGLKADDGAPLFAVTGQQVTVGLTFKTKLPNRH